MRRIHNISTPRLRIGACKALQTTTSLRDFCEPPIAELLDVAPRPELVAAASNKPRARKKRLTSPERWEVTQLIKSGVLSVEEYPDFDDEHGQVRAAAARV